MTILHIVYISLVEVGCFDTAVSNTPFYLFIYGPFNDAVRS